MTSNRQYRFRVSDAVAVPLRGMLLRLRLVEGSADVDDLRPGESLKLHGPGGEERTVTIKALPTTAGRQSQERLDRYREFDVVIPASDAVQNGIAIEIGWHATTP